MPQITDFGRSMIVAIDLKRDWKNLVEHAIPFAEWAEATLHLTYVLPSPSSTRYGHLDKTAHRVHMRHLRDDAQQHLEEMTRELEEKGVASHVTLLSGKHTAKAILKYAQSVKAGLIIAGASVPERTEFLFVGTTADQLVRHSKVPVLITGPKPSHPFKRILAPTDLDRSGQSAIRLAYKLATLSEGQATILHAYAQASPHHDPNGRLFTPSPEVQAKIAQAFDTFVDQTPMPPGTPPIQKRLMATSETVDASVAIVAEATREHMELIVMSLGRISFFEHYVIGAVTERVLRNLPCTLLALPTTWARRH